MSTIGTASLFLCLFLSLFLAPPSWASSELEFEFVARFADGQLTLECREGCMFGPPTAHECPRNECIVTVRDRGMSISGLPSTSMASLAISSDGPEPRFEVSLVPKGSYVEVQCERGCGWQVERFDCDVADECTATIDELGIRLGAVPFDRQAAYEEQQARQNPASRSIQCMAGQIVQARMQGGPITLEVAREEAEAACIEYRAALVDSMAASGGSEEQLKQMLEKLLTQIWTMDLPQQRQ